MQELQKLFIHAVLNTLPKGFSQWSQTGHSGLKFPECLKETSLEKQLKYRIAWIDYTQNNWSIAHVAAMFNTDFAEDFPHWSLKTKQGQTVAHIFAKYQKKIYPSCYYLENDCHQTVLDVYRSGLLFNSYGGA
jgi:hypothetical protein